MAQAQAQERKDPRPSPAPAAAPAVEAQAQETPERADPKPRRMRMPPGTVMFKRTDREYVFVNPNDQVFGLNRHLDDGWKPVGAGDPERVYAGRQNPADGTWSFQGQVLLWMDKAEFDDALAAAQELVAARETKARAPGGIDGVHGVDGQPAEIMERHL